ncbi:hypothetical protein M3Y97_00186400 [Aphelenchoides bicaudatus]|nr:hypothetical protein M3Y97_00186400 [Aphelenchoides bicaudatus]
MRAHLPLLFLVFCQCWINCGNAQRSKFTQAPQTTQTPSKVPPFKCEYLQNRPCKSFDFFCADVTPTTSCACQLSSSYKVIAENSTVHPPPSDQCQKSVHLTPFWLIFLAVIGLFFVFIILCFACWLLWASNCLTRLTQRVFTSTKKPGNEHSLLMSNLAYEHDGKDDDMDVFTRDDEE